MAFKMKGFTPFTDQHTADLQEKCIDAGGKWENGKCVFPKKKKQQAPDPPPRPKETQWK